MSYSTEYVTWRSTTQAAIAKDYGVNLTNDLIDDLLVHYDEFRESGQYKPHDKNHRWKMHGGLLIADQLHLNPTAKLGEIAGIIAEKHRKFQRLGDPNLLMCA